MKTGKIAYLADFKRTASVSNGPASILNRRDGEETAGLPPVSLPTGFTQASFSGEEFHAFLARLP